MNLLSNPNGKHYVALKPKWKHYVALQPKWETLCGTQTQMGNMIWHSNPNGKHYVTLKSKWEILGRPLTYPLPFQGLRHNHVYICAPMCTEPIHIYLHKL